MFLRDESNAVELDKSHILIHIYDRELYIYDMTVFRNGLVCLLASTFLKSWKTILWNPATREFRELPEPNLHVDGILIHDISINSGFDPQNKDYKLLRMAKITDYSHLDDVKKIILVHVFSLKSNCWSEVKPYPRLGSCLPSSYVQAFSQKSSCVELNGVLYWLNVISDDILSFEIDGILSFDLSSGIFGELDTPRQCQCIRELVKWERKSLAVIVQNFPLNEFECWAMQENDLSSGSKPTWTKQWTSGTPSVGRWCWEDPATFRVNRDEHGNMESSSLDVPREEDDMSCWQVENTFEYVESLVSVHPEQ